MHLAILYHPVFSLTPLPLSFPIPSFPPPTQAAAPRAKPVIQEGLPESAPSGGARRGPRPPRTAPPAAEREEGAEETEPGALRIRATSKPKAVAGAVANKLRGGEIFSLNGELGREESCCSCTRRTSSLPSSPTLSPPPLHPTPPPPPGIGALSVNQAIKSAIIARSYLKDDGIDLAMRPRLVEEVGPDVVSLAIIKHTSASDKSAPEEFCFKSAGSTQAGSLAGALANKIREGATFLSITSVGPDAALRSIKSIAMATGYVKEDGYEILCVPVFVDLKLGDEERTGVRLDIFASKA